MDTVVLRRSISFDSKRKETLRMVSFKTRDSDDKTPPDFRDSCEKTDICLEKWKPKKLKFDKTVSYTQLVLDGGENMCLDTKGDALIQDANLPPKSSAELGIKIPPRPVSELDEAALKVQKVYKSYRTRRNLADCAVVVEELWWKALDFAALKRSSVSFFRIEKPESAVSRWARAKTRAAKVGKGLSKDEKAQKLALRHWLEAIDPRHRYGHNLHLYYDVWFNSQSSQPFFYWLDVGDGKEVNLDKCQRTILQHQCIKYLGQIEREAYEVIIKSGKLVYKQSGVPLETIEGSKWIFVLSTSRNLYVGEKKKGLFQHSSFLAGGATTASGRLVAHNGILEAIWPYSGHYCPTEENFMEFTRFLEEHNVDLSNVKRCAIDDDIPPVKSTKEEEWKPSSINQHGHHLENAKAPVLKLGQHQSSKWTTGVGPRIGCVREYPPKLQHHAMEQVNLSPRLKIGPFSSGTQSIPSPRPSPSIHLSPRLAKMGLPSPRQTNPSSNSRRNNLDKNSSGSSWLDGWIASKPWESRLVEEMKTVVSESTPKFKKHEDYIVGSRASFSEFDSVKVKRNNMSTRITAKPPVNGQITRSSSDPYSEFLYDERSTSNSYSSNSEKIPWSSNSQVEGDNTNRPSYMNLTKSIRAKQRGWQNPSHNMKKLVTGTPKSHKKTMQLSCGDTRSNAGSDLYSVSLCNDLYPPLMNLDGYD